MNFYLAIKNKPGFLEFIILLPVLVGCSVVSGPLEVSVLAEGNKLPSTNMLEEVEPVIRSLGRGGENPDLLQVRRRAWRK